MSIITNIVGRCHVGDSHLSVVTTGCHVGDSHLSVVRTVLSSLIAGRSAFLRMPQDIRRDFLKRIIEAHNANRKLFKDCRF